MQIERFSAALRDLIDDDVEESKLASGFVWAEGPVWDGASESIIFTDFTPERLYRFNAREGLALHSSESGRAVGLTLDRTGRLIACESRRRRVARIEPDGTSTVLASLYDGKRLNSPNDVIVKSDGSVYFTDPYSTALGDTRELDWNGVYRVGTEGGALSLVAAMNRPNGLAFSPDESLLYVDDTNLNRVNVHEVRSDGTLGPGRIFVELDTTAGKGGADGMKADARGNLYVTGPGGIWIIDPSGRPLGILRLPETAANLCWGGKDRMTLYVTATTSLYSIRMSVQGASETRIEGQAEWR